MGRRSRSGWGSRALALAAVVLAVLVPGRAAAAPDCRLDNSCVPEQPVPLPEWQLGDTTTYDGAFYSYRCGRPGGGTAHGCTRWYASYEALREAVFSTMVAATNADEKGWCPDGSPGVGVHLEDPPWATPGSPRFFRSQYPRLTHPIIHKLGFEQETSKYLHIRWRCAGAPQQFGQTYEVLKRRGWGCPQGTVHNSPDLCRPDGAQPGKNNGACCPVNPASQAPKVGDPIYPSTGNVYLGETDYRGAGPYPLVLGRHYNSFGRGWSSVTGRKWRHDYERAVVRFGEVATVVRGDGARLTFLRQGDDGWATQTDVRARLEAERDAAGTVTGWELRLPDDTVERYDGDGRWRSATRRGLTHTAGYDAGGRLATVSDPFGRTLTFGYGETHLETVTDPAGQVIRYAHDLEGRLRSVTHEAAGDATATTTRRYHYEDAVQPWLLTGVTDARGIRAATWEYDAQGRAVWNERAGGASPVAVDYGADGTATVRDGLGRASSYRFEERLGTVRVAATSGDACRGCPLRAAAIDYDARGWPVRSVDLAGVETRVRHDLRGLETQRVEAVGTASERTVTTQWHPLWRQPVRRFEPGRETTFGYDAAGRLLRHTVRDTATGRARTTRWHYGADGLLASVDGPREDVDDVTTFAYEAGNLVSVTDAMGHETRYTAHDAHGRVRAMVDANGVETTFAYDARGRRTARTHDGATTRYRYDAVGNLLQVTLPDGSAMRYEYDDANRRVAMADAAGNRVEYELDVDGNRVAERVRDATGARSRERRREFDRLGRLARALGGEGQVRDYAYDAMDRPVAVVDGEGGETAHAWDALGRLAASVDAMGGITGYGYDGRGNLVSVSDPRGVETAYRYDGLDDLVAEASADRGRTEYATDATGNVIRRTDARGVTTTYAHDALGRLTHVGYPDASRDVTYTYDTAANGVGRLARIDDESGHTAYEYDRRGNLAAEHRRLGEWVFTTRYRHDDADRVVAMTYPSGLEVDYRRDRAGRVVEVTARRAGRTTVLAAVLEHAPFGPALRWRSGNGLESSARLDRAGRVVHHKVDGLLDRRYHHDASDNVLRITDARAPHTDQTFDYDPLDRLIGASGVYGEVFYDYDANGNRTDRERWSDHGVAREEYVVDPGSNRVLGIEDDEHDITLDALEYDAAGNVTRRAGRTLVWGDSGRLDAVLAGGVEQVRFTYNALGERVLREAADGTTTLFVFGPDGALLAEADGDGRISREHVWLDGRLLAQVLPEPAPAAATAPQRYVATGGTWSKPGPWQVAFEPATRALTVWRDGAVVFDGARGRAAWHSRGPRRITAGLHGDDGRYAVLSFDPGPEHAPGATPAPQPMRTPAPPRPGFLALYDRVTTTTASGATLSRYVLDAHVRDLALAPETDLASPVRFVHLDPLGTPQALTDATGTLVWQADYEPFGRLVERVADTDQPVRFPGQYADPAVGAYYNYQRWYDPDLGRYLSSDPIGLVGGMNTYSYAGGNPLTRIDPRGEFFVLLVPAIPLWSALAADAALIGSLIYGIHNSSNVDGGEQCGTCDGDATSPSNPDPCDIFPELCVPSNQGSRPKPVNLPSASKIKVDMEHIASGHIRGGSRVSVNKTLFPDTMNEVNVRNAILRAYKRCSRVETQGSRVRVQGTDPKTTLRVEMWVNAETGTIETAYPLF